MSKRLVVWSYAVELLASAAVLVALCLWLGAKPVVDFVRTAAIDIATLFGAVMLAAALAFLWTFFSKADTPFYRWLESKGAFKVYVSATTYTVTVSFLSTASLVVAKYLDSQYVGLVATYLLLLAMVNLYTLVGNVAGLMKLNAAFERARGNA